MSTNSKIQWTDATWNPVRGCTRVSAGCENCYAERMASRFWPDLATRTPNGPRWTGEVEFREDELTKPLHWRKPRRVFVCSMGDLFHGAVKADWIDQVFAIAALCPQHTFQILTKRPERMVEYFSRFGDGVECVGRIGAVDQWAFDIARRQKGGPRWAFGWNAVPAWPLPNVWLGVSVENQEVADERIPLLLQTPAAVRFLSCEPLLGPIDLPWLRPCTTGLGSISGPLYDHGDSEMLWPPLDWLICGGETGPHKRDMNTDWARSLRDQCREADVPFFFKQDGNGGHTLDGREYHEYPPRGGIEP